MDMIQLDHKISLNYLRSLKKQGFRIQAKVMPPNCGGRRQLAVLATADDAEKLNSIIKATRGPFYTK